MYWPRNIKYSALQIANYDKFLHLMENSYECRWFNELGVADCRYVASTIFCLPKLRKIDASAFKELSNILCGSDKITNTLKFVMNFSRTLTAHSFKSIFTLESIHYKTSMDSNGFRGSGIRKMYTYIPIRRDTYIKKEKRDGKLYHDCLMLLLCAPHRVFCYVFFLLFFCFYFFFFGETPRNLWRYNFPVLWPNKISLRWADHLRRCVPEHR